MVKKIPKYSDLVWAISHISQIVGQGINAEHAEIDMYSWQVDNPSDPHNKNPRWWMHIIADDNGQIGLVIEKENIPFKAEKFSSVFNAISEHAKHTNITVEIVDNLESESV